LPRIWFGFRLKKCVEHICGLADKGHTFLVALGKDRGACKGFRLDVVDFDGEGEFALVSFRWPTMSSYFQCRTHRLTFLTACAESSSSALAFRFAAGDGGWIQR
jgi:hypothetical protein